MNSKGEKGKNWRGSKRCPDVRGGKRIDTATVRGRGRRGSDWRKDELILAVVKKKKGGS